jgi:Protein of unknown function (DUF2971)
VGSLRAAVFRSSSFSGKGDEVMGIPTIGMDMEEKKSVPKRLYKYMALSSRTLDLLVSDHVYYADPSTFNDPLDTRPSLKIDVAAAELQEILRRFIERRTEAEMSAAAQTIRYSGPKTMDHIRRHSRRQGEQLIAEISYNAMDPEYDSDDPTFYLAHYIAVELLRQYDKGIVSLAEQATCPLMWSHYGDQHHGVCIGYSVPERTASNVHKVRYDGSRLVEASKVAAMLAGNDVARVQVDEAVLLRKAGSWHYEREWRLIGQRGLRNSPLELEEVIFGVRCEESVKYAVVKALKGRVGQVKFYRMREVPGTFRLKKYALNDDDELFAYFPIRSLSTYEAFEHLPLPLQGRAREGAA